MTLQSLDDGAQSAALADRGVGLLLNMSNRLDMPGSFGRQQRAQGIRIGGERVVGVGSHPRTVPVAP